MAFHSFVGKQNIWKNKLINKLIGSLINVKSKKKLVLSISPAELFSFFILTIYHCWGKKKTFNLWLFLDT